MDAVVARLGGDEFGLLLRDVAQEAGASSLLTAVQHTLSAAMRARFPDLPVGASVGGAFHPAHGVDTSTLLHCADLAMYQAKHETHRVELYQPWFDHDLLSATDARTVSRAARSRSVPGDHRSAQ